eukprot:5012173-Ditylum_brightwellii.AAC.1
MDIITQIVQVIQTLKCTKSFKHVKGCQNDEVVYADLDLPARLNIDADFLAVNSCTIARQKYTQVPRLPVNKA